jgi:thymidylate synthase (FAD)
MRDEAVLQYLKDTGNDEFWESVVAARNNGLTSAEILCSMFAKLCYKSLVVGKNANISRVRDIDSNIRGCFDTGHGSIFEHVGFNFLISDCSRVFTHELVRHRIGTAFSQTSGRYVRPIDDEGNGILDVVFDPILEPVKNDVLDVISFLETRYSAMVDKMGLNDMKDFTRKKKITSALRRILPNGQSNEIGFSVNLRTLRHTIMMRTGRHAEWEIRLVFEQLYLLLKDQYPTIFHGAKEEVVEGIIEVSGMKMQPYETTSEALLSEMSDGQLEQELARRRSNSTV